MPIIIPSEVLGQGGRSSGHLWLAYPSDILYKGGACLCPSSGFSFLQRMHAFAHFGLNSTAEQFQSWAQVTKGGYDSFLVSAKGEA